MAHQLVLCHIRGIFFFFSDPRDELFSKKSNREIFLWNWNRVLVESNFSAELMINLSIQNFIFFLVLDLFPSGLKRKTGYGGHWNQAGLCWTLLVTKVVLCPYLLLLQKGFGLLGFPWVTKNSFKQLIIRKVRECRNEVKAVQETKCSDKAES